MKAHVGSFSIFLLAWGCFDLARAESHEVDADLFTALNSEGATEVLTLVNPDGSAVYPKQISPNNNDWALYYSSRLVAGQERILSSPRPICDAGTAVSDVVTLQSFAIGVVVCRYTPLGGFEPDNNDFTVVAWNKEQVVILGETNGYAIPSLFVEDGGQNVVIEWQVHTDWIFPEGEDYSEDTVRPVFQPRRAKIFMPEDSSNLELQMIME